MENKVPGFFIRNKYLLIISAISFLIIYLSSFIKAYGFFIDEFYYIACANRPAMGYVDHPPLAPLLLTIFQFIFGSSIYAVRFLPALAASASGFMTGIITREIKGGTFAQCLAAAAISTSPIIVTFGSFYSMNPFEPLLAVIILYFTIRMIKENNPGRWLAIGITMGVGMMNKHTFAVFIIGLVISLVAAGKWKLFFNKWFVLGTLSAVIIFIPNIIWQVLNNYPSLEFYKNISTYKNVFTPPLAFILGQVLTMSPFTLPVWLAGILFLLFSKPNKEYRFLAILFLFLFIVMMLSGTSRPDRMAFAYPGVFAGGALFYERFIQKRNAEWLKSILIGFMYLGLAMALPITLPYFSYAYVYSYTKLIGFNTELEKGNKPLIPQLLADRIGWEDKFNLVLKAYQSLPDSEKKQTFFASGNYGQAGAIEYFGKKYNLPASLTSHNTYYLWSRDYLIKNNISDSAIVLQLARTDEIDALKQRFHVVKGFPDEFSNNYVTRHENNLKVFYCRRPKIHYLRMLDYSKFYF